MGFTMNRLRQYLCTYIVEVTGSARCNAIHTHYTHSQYRCYNLMQNGTYTYIINGLVIITTSTLSYTTSVATSTSRQYPHYRVCKGDIGVLHTLK